MKKEITAEEQSRSFELLDEYVRAKHNCFVSEFFRKPEADVYEVCFRPRGGSKNDSNRYACKYLQFHVEHLQQMAAGTSLPVSVADELDKALSTLPRH